MKSNREKMKNCIIRYLILFASFLPFLVNAQETGNTPAKGKRGGHLLKGDDQVYFEIVDNGTKVSFYPCDRNGDILTAVPTDADITIVYIATSETYYQPDVKLSEGAFTIYPPRDMPIYIYAIGYGPKESRNVVKFRDPSAPRPR